MTSTGRQNVIFGTGPLGQWVMAELVDQKKPVTLVNRSGAIRQKLPDQVTITAGDATEPDSVYQICKEADVVYHCAMPPYTDWPEKFPPLAKGILGGVSRTNARLIFGDNLYMYGPTGGKRIHENLPYAATGPKGKIRAQMAQDLLDANRAGNIRVVIGRGSDFFGPRVVNAALGDMFFTAALKGKPANLLGNPDKLHTYTYIKDFAKALVTLADREEALGKAWHVPSAETISTRQMVNIVEKEIDRPIKIRAAGRLMVSILGLFNPMVREVKEMMYEWEEDYIVDHSKFEQSFGAETTPHGEAIRETVAWFRNRLG